VGDVVLGVDPEVIASSDAVVGLRFIDHDLDRSKRFAVT
jgi:hypothetical protein